MTKGMQIKRTILEFLADGKDHSTSEIHNYIAKCNIKVSPKSTIVRNVLFTLKNENPNVVNTKRGHYQYINTPPNTNDSYTTLQNSISTLKKYLKKYANFNWITCTEQQLNIARQEVQLLLNFSSEVNSYLRINDTLSH